MHIIAGLGNPGRKYANHRHNVGFMAAERIARRHSFSPWTSKFQAEIAEGRLGGEKVLLVKPQTFMNLSGEAIGKALRFYKLSADDLTVLYDEIDLPPGKIRARTGGSSGGHNGIRSTDAHCGTGYHRVRIGIGRPADKSRVTAYVLGDFSKADETWLEPLLDTIAEHAGLLVERQHATFMNRISLARADEKNDADRLRREPANEAGYTPSASAEAAKAQGPMAAMLRRLLGRE